MKEGKVHFIDVQEPNRNAEDYFKDISTKSKYSDYSNVFWRTDNVNFDPVYISDICKAKK